MITIIKPGKQIFTITCPICDCEFRYEPEDINIIDEGIGHKYTRIVICPNCSNKIHIDPTPRDIRVPMAGEPVKC